MSCEGVRFLTVPPQESPHRGHYSWVVYPEVSSTTKFGHMGAFTHTHTHLRNKAVRALNTRPTPRLLHTAHPDFARLVTSGSMQVCAERSGLLIETGIVEVSMLDVVGRAVKSEKCLLALCAFTCRTCVFFDFLLLSFCFPMCSYDFRLVFCALLRFPIDLLLVSYVSL